MRIVIEFLFPKRLARLSYFIRTLLCDGVLLYLYKDVSSESPSGIVALIGTLFYVSLFVLLPRMRDIGMRAGWIALAFIPYISSFLSIVLLFRRTNLRHSPLLQRSPGMSILSRPDAETGPQAS